MYVESDTLPMSAEERSAALEFAGRRPLLTAMESNPKTAKRLGEFGILGKVLHLASFDSATRAVGKPVNVCPLAAVNGCEGACLDHQGRGAMR